MPCTILSFHEELFSSNPPILLHEFVQFQRHPPEIRRKDLFISLSAINMFYLTDSYIGFTLKMESVSKNTIFGLKMMVKSGLEKFIWKSLHAGR